MWITGDPEMILRTARKVRFSIKFKNLKVAVAIYL
jgi:hypothetical protein